MMASADKPLEASSAGFRLGSNIPPLARDGLLADSSDSVSNEGFVSSLTVSNVAQDTSAVRPVEGVVDR